MSATMIHTMDTAWTSSNLALLDVAVDTAVTIGESTGSNRFRANGAANQTVVFTPAVPLDLSTVDELRFWIRSSRAADGSDERPFYLEFAYTDAGDTPTDVHRWFMAINRQGAWEQRRIGIENDRRSQVSSLEFRCLSDAPFSCNVDEILAVRDELVSDVERALERRIADLSVPGVVAVPVAVAASIRSDERDGRAEPRLSKREPHPPPGRERGERGAHGRHGYPQPRPESYDARLRAWRESRWKRAFDRDGHTARSRVRPGTARVHGARGNSDSGSHVP